MINIKNILDKSDGYLFMVVRTNKYVLRDDEYNSYGINFGLYRVVDVPCSNEDEWNAVVSNFSHVLEDDPNAILTFDELRAYSYMASLNHIECCRIEEQYLGICNKKDKSNDWYDFEAEVANMCEIAISTRKSKKDNKI